MDKFVILTYIIGEPNNSGGSDFSLMEGCAQFVYPDDCMIDLSCKSSSYYICKMGNEN